MKKEGWRRDETEEGENREWTKVGERRRRNRGECHRQRWLHGSKNVRATVFIMFSMTWRLDGIIYYSACVKGQENMAEKCLLKSTIVLKESLNSIKDLKFTQHPQNICSIQI